MNSKELFICIKKSPLVDPAENCMKRGSRGMMPKWFVQSLEEWHVKEKDLIISDMNEYILCAGDVV